ncbi:hypothetical protein FIBSPDRAFT_775451 [Athelia psychrophila]|uniref:G domain-containing protein n=1 Tax=Athelia psychrophila TaxID=1759441 RepID=A0A166UU88_9AGAM|nr:hypothetical protein FIBSPDRAFT_775451 [Fibularhizoctonia sp. CBS 109695]
MQAEDQIVAVMGPTGAGKSTFIEYATGNSAGTVGHGLQSFTTAIREARVPHRKKPFSVVFVDTPGFDDTEKTDVEVLAMIADWLVTVYKEKAKLVAIIYLHRINENRMGGSLMKNLQIFSNMCGRQAMPNVVIVTTMWGEVSLSIGARREEELKVDFWNDMLANGCKIARFEDSYESAWSIVGDLLENRTTQVLLSAEMVEDRHQLNETKAAVALNHQLQKLVKEQKDATRLLHEQARKQDDQLLAERLLQQRKAIQEDIFQTQEQLRRLKIPLKRQLASNFGSIKASHFGGLHSLRTVRSSLI